MVNKLMFVLLFLGFAVALSGQPILYLKKQGAAKTNKVMVGDKVKIKTREGETAKGYVLSITPEGLQVGPLSVGFEELRYIRTYESLAKGAGKSLEYGALFFGGIIVINAIITSASPFLTQGEIIFISSFLAAGVLLELLSQRTYRLDKNWKTEVIIIPLE